jgi:hypothetical protein
VKRCQIEHEGWASTAHPSWLDLEKTSGIQPGLKPKKRVQKLSCNQQT